MPRKEKDIRRCIKCGLPLIQKCDRTQPSIRVDWDTGNSIEPSTKIWMYPPAKEQPTLCFYCANLEDLKVGKET